MYVGSGLYIRLDERDLEYEDMTPPTDRILFAQDVGRLRCILFGPRVRVLSGQRAKVRGDVAAISYIHSSI